MKHVIQTPLRQGVTQQSPAEIAEMTKPLYQPPRVIVYGSVIQLTKGSGGDYDDECTSGHQPGDDE